VGLPQFGLSGCYSLIQPGPEYEKTMEYTTLPSFIELEIGLIPLKDGSLSLLYLASGKVKQSHLSLAPLKQLASVDPTLLRLLRLLRLLKLGHFLLAID
jgi:hypothetical protein